MVSKSDMARKTSKMGGFTVTEICIAVVLIVLLAAVLIPRFVASSRAEAQANACISNLRIIAGAEHGWILENRKQYTDIPAGSDIQPYLGRGSAGELPFCPNDPRQTFDTSYSLHNDRTYPTCKIVPANHVLR